MKERRDAGLYWDRAWKLVEGCTKVSPGCDNCWSEAETVMHTGHPNEKIRGRAQAVIDPQAGFDGRITCREDNLDLPLHTKNPTVFSVWNDLFHEGVPLEFLTEVMVRMDRARLQGHTFLVLTKRAEAMADYLCSVGVDAPEHIWWGVTAENQEQADARIPHLLTVPGNKFLSLEPLLGPIDLDRIHESGRNPEGGGWDSWESCLNGKRFDPWSDRTMPGYPKVDAVLLGGESGKNARPMHPDWVRSVRDQCAAAGVPFFFKQNGEFASVSEVEGPGYHHIFEGGATVRRCGKKRAGRTLDGRTHDDLPWEVQL